MMNTKEWLNQLRDRAQKQALPILSFPCVSLLGVTVDALVQSSVLQAEGMARVAARVPSAASVSMMDLSVEAEAFGARVRFDANEMPAVTDVLIHNEEEANALPVPAVGAGRTGVYVEAIRLAVQKITDRPVFAGMIGPLSLTGRLVGASEAMFYCYDEPILMQRVLERAERFLTEYALAFKAAGANGLIIAEPLAGLLSAKHASAFSHPYIRRIVETVQDDSFQVLYHNCGESTSKMTDDLVGIGAAAYHFGNKVDMRDILEKMPAHTIVLGNLDPAGQFRNGTPQTIAEETSRLLVACAEHRNFLISSGCDIPPATPWENIDAFFAAVQAFYERE